MKTWTANPKPGVFIEAHDWCEQYLEPGSWWYWRDVFEFDNKSNWTMFVLKWG